MLEPFRYPWILLLLESQENYSDRRYEEWSLTGKGRSLLNLKDSPSNKPDSSLLMNDDCVTAHFYQRIVLE